MISGLSITPQSYYYEFLQRGFNIVDAGANTSLADNTTAIQNAINKVSNAGGGTVLVPVGSFSFSGFLNIPANVNLIGMGVASNLVATNTNGNTIEVTGNNVILRDFQLSGNVQGGIQINNGVSNVLVENVYFKTLTQCVWLWACTNVTVSKCTFDNTGYGVIQQSGNVSSHVQIINNRAFNMKSDFVEANCTSSAMSENWIVSGNIYEGSAQYPTAGTETRFVGFTGVKNVVISNNVVEKTTGDAAVHLEDGGDQTIITGNTFRNCTGGNYSYLYLLNSSEETIISNNFFIQDDTSLPENWVLNLNSGIYTNKVVFANNFVKGNASYLLDAIDASTHTGLSVTGNTFEQCNYILRASQATATVFSNNTIKDCNYGLASNAGASGGGFNDLVVTGNHMECNTRCVDMHMNTNGTNGSNQMVFTGNYFGADAIANDTTDVYAFGNVVKSGHTMNLGGTEYFGSTRYTALNTALYGTGLLAQSLGSIQNLQLTAEASAPNNSIYIDSADNKLKFKDNSGTVTIIAS